MALVMPFGEFAGTELAAVPRGELERLLAAGALDAYPQSRRLAEDLVTAPGDEPALLAAVAPVVAVTVATEGDEDELTDHPTE